MYIIIFMGSPGTGKGTLAIKCQTELNLVHISTGALCRQYAQKDNEIGKKIAERIDNGILIEDFLMLQMLQDRIGYIDILKNDIIFDGFPRNIDQIKLLFKTFIHEKIIFVFFEASNDVIINRLKNRIICSNSLCDQVYNGLTYTSSFCKICGSLLKKRKDDSEDIIYKRLQIYNDEFPKIKEYIKNNGILYIEINAELSKLNLFNDFLIKINEKKKLFCDAIKI